MKKLLVVSMIFVIVFGWGAVPAKAAPPEPFDLVKQCDGSYGQGVCGIVSASSPLGVLAGGTIEYTDHKNWQNDAEITHEAATILITASDGSTAVGHVSWVLINGEFIGSFTILPGTDSLAGFHASGKIDVLSWESMQFSLAGTYFFTQ